MAFIGIDYASVDENSKPDWFAAKSAGCRFVILRGTYSTWADPIYKRDSAAIRAAGITLGAYMFPVIGKDKPSAKEQVDAFVKSVGPLTNKDLPPILDVEFPGGIAKTGMDRKALLAWVMEAFAALKQMYGIASMAYTSARVWDGEDSDSLDADKNGFGKPDPILLECPLWLARYSYPTRVDAVGDTKDEQLTVDGLPWPPVPKAWGDYTNVWIHQYQGDGLQFPGFDKTTDMNRFHLLQQGDTGDRVKWVQRRLGVKETGLFDSAMVKDVKDWQYANNLRVDALIGPASFAALSWSRPQK